MVLKVWEMFWKSMSLQTSENLKHIGVDVTRENIKKELAEPWYESVVRSGHMLGSCRLNKWLRIPWETGNSDKLEAENCVTRSRNFLWILVYIIDVISNRSECSPNESIIAGSFYPKRWTMCRNSRSPDSWGHTLLGDFHNGRGRESANEVREGSMIGRRRRASDR
jgi:hypothetical protein